MKLLALAGGVCCSLVSRPITCLAIHEPRRPPATRLVEKTNMMRGPGDCHAIPENTALVPLVPPQSGALMRHIPAPPGLIVLFSCVYGTSKPPPLLLLLHHLLLLCFQEGRRSKQRLRSPWWRRRGSGPANWVSGWSSEEDEGKQHEEGPHPHPPPHPFAPQLQAHLSQ